MLLNLFTVFQMEASLKDCLLCVFFCFFFIFKLYFQVEIHIKNTSWRMVASESSAGDFTKIRIREVNSQIKLVLSTLGTSLKIGFTNNFLGFSE